MKALTLKDILPNIELPLTRLSVYFEGQWAFATFNTPTRTTETQSFYLISLPFGLVRQGVLTPSKRVITGKPGSYAILDRDGSLTMATPEQYEMIFPRILIDRPLPPITSKELVNTKHITNVVRKSRNEGSNTIQVGTQTFNNTLPNKTITILPSGVQVAVLREDPNDPFQVSTTPEGGPTPIPVPGSVLGTGNY